MRPADTSPEIHEMQMAKVRRLTGEERMQHALEMIALGRSISAAGIRARHPDYDDDDVRWALTRMRFGDGLFRAAWPDAPVIAP